MWSCSSTKPPRGPFTSSAGRKFTTCYFYVSCFCASLLLQWISGVNCVFSGGSPTPTWTSPATSTSWKKDSIITALTGVLRRTASVQCSPSCWWETLTSSRSVAYSLLSIWLLLTVCFFLFLGSQQKLVNSQWGDCYLFFTTICFPLPTRYILKQYKEYSGLELSSLHVSLFSCPTEDPLKAAFQGMYEDTH